MEMVSVACIAQLQGCSRQNILKKIKCGELPCEKARTDTNVPQYLVPLDALDPVLQRRYKERQSGARSVAVQPVCTAQKEKPLETYSAEERAEIDRWVQVVERWQAYREKPGVQSKAAVDNAFVQLMTLEAPGLTVSVPILYRRWAALREKDWDGLLDKRGKWRRGSCETPTEILDVFFSYYLDESRYPVERCIEYTRLYLQEHSPELVAKMPSYSTFNRKAKELPYPVMVLGRMGEKAYYDLCSPYVRREYESIASNEWWVADTHTFDIISQDGGTRKTHRIYLNAYLDARSGIFVGWYVTANPNSAATLQALRKGIRDFGIPRHIYVDNGREYLTYDIGGRGHRAKKTLADGSAPFAPPGVFARLGIEMTNAIVRNARAKIIERRFRDVKDHISRLFCSYCGGSVAEKPDRLKGVLKADKSTTIEASRVVTDDRLIEIAEALISGYMNYQPYNGSVAEDRGKRRIDVYMEHLADMPQRKADPAELALMLMRTTRPQQVGRNGVFVPMGGKKVWYTCSELHTLMGKKVYVRYDPEEIGSVRVYDMDDRYILEAPRDEKLELPYGADKQAVAEAMAHIRRARKNTMEALNASRLPLADEDSALSLVLGYAQANLVAAPVPPPTNTIELVRPAEKPLLEAVNSGRIDMSRMTRNAVRRNNETKECED